MPDRTQPAPPFTKNLSTLAACTNGVAKAKRTNVDVNDLQHLTSGVSHVVNTISPPAVRSIAGSSVSNSTSH